MKLSFPTTVIGLLTVSLISTSIYFVTSRCQATAASSLSQPRLSQPLRAATKVRLSVTPNVLFDYVSEEKTLPDWMPGLRITEYNHSQSATNNRLDKGSQRLMIFGEQTEIEEIIQFDRPSKISYRIIEGVPINNHLAIISIAPDEQGGSVLSWYQYFEIKRSSIIGWAMPFMVRRFMNEAQNNLIAAFQGEAVEDNICR